MEIDPTELDDAMAAATTRAFGEVAVRPLTVNDMIELEEADAAAAFTTDNFSAAMAKLLCARADGAPLTDADMLVLDADDRAQIVRGLLSSNRFLFSLKASSGASEGSGEVPAPTSEKLLPRDEGEADEAYLLRGWRDYRRRFAAQTREAMGARMAGLSEQLKKALAPSLAVNTAASLRLSSQLKAMQAPSLKLAEQLREAMAPSLKLSAAVKALTQPSRGIVDQMGKLGIGAKRFQVDPELKRVVEQIKPTRGLDATALIDAAAADRAKSSPEYSFPTIPPNPAHQTNALLEEMSRHIGEMRDLAATTAEMQQSLNDVAATILTEFSKGAEDSRVATGRALKIAVGSTILSLIAVLASIWGVFYQDLQSTKRDKSDEKASQSLLRATKDNTKALDRFVRGLEAERAGVLAGRSSLPAAKTPKPPVN